MWTNICESRKNWISRYLSNSVGVFFLIRTVGIAFFLTGTGYTYAQQDVEATASTGQQLYLENCEICHGVDGRGDGPGAYLLNPKPRNFRKGGFRLVSTDNGIPTENDIVRTISRGMPGTAMPPWPRLSTDELQALARYVLGLRKDELVQSYIHDGLTPEVAQARAEQEFTPGSLITATQPPGPYDANAAEQFYIGLCASCHGEDGAGRNYEWLLGIEGMPVASRNFVKGVYKGGRSDLDLYRRIAAGLPGSPMPPLGGLPPQQIWQMVRYIQNLSEPSAQEQAWIKAPVLTAKHVVELPSSPLDSTWNRSQASGVRLFPLWAEDAAVINASVRALTNGTELALLVEWEDPQQDRVTTSATSFSDRVAVEFSTDANPPLFAMGRSDRQVSIWQWANAPRATETFPDRGFYYSDKGGWQNAPVRSAEDPYLTARAVGNSLFAAAGGATGYNARGIGTLEANKQDMESPVTVGQWSDGHWHVLFRRAIHTKRTDDLDLDVGQTSFAVAVWDGRLGDRNGKKSVSIWGQINIGTTD